MAEVAPGAVVAGYRIESLLGRGGMGAVYRATQLALKRPVALKVIATPLASDPGFCELFRREGVAAASIDHPHVVPVFEAGEFDGLLFLSMRLVEGEALAAMLRPRCPLEAARALRLAGQIADALEAAHARGVVHRDVKPANVLVTGDAGREHAHLVDFGIASVAGGDALTGTGRAIGTLGYIAPEVLRGEPVDGRADVYALGCVLFEALTGVVPFPRESEAAVLSAHLFEPVPSVRDRVSDLAPELDVLVQSMLAKRPDERPQRAGDVATALRAPATSSQSGSLPPPGRSRLPRGARTLIGRARDLRALVAACRAGESRLVTLTGPGGVGKTELALLAAQHLVEDFADGVFWVELESLSDAAAVAPVIARALELADEPGITPLERVIDHAGSRRMLIVLDNFEHLMGAATDLARIVAGAPLTRLLVTSQAPLRVRDERMITLAPLELPSTSAGTAPELLAEVPSVALLVERARRVAPEFALTERNADAAAELCRRLDGLPLALELAAARLSLLDPAELLARLERSIDALGPGARDLPERQRGLRAALSWTTQQLNVADRALLARLAVFAGGFTVDLAEAVGDGDVLAGLDALRDVSLIRRDASGRLSIPPPVRAYALELLRAAGEEDTARLRHATAIIDLAERENWVRDYICGLRMVRAEADNLRDALRWTRDARPEAHARLIAASAQLLSQAGQDQEFAPDVEVALGRVRDLTLRARLLLQRAFVLEGSGDPEPFRVAAVACREAGEQHALIEALFGLANVHAARGEGAPSLAAAEEAHALAERLGDQPYVDTAAQMVGQALRLSGRADEALAILQQVAERARPGSWSAIGALTLVADAALDAGDPAGALTGYGRSLWNAHELGAWPNVALQLDGAALALAALGRHEEALTTAAASNRVRHEFSCRVASEWLATRDEALAPSRAALGLDGERGCVTRAEAMGLERAIAWVEALASASPTAV